MQDNKRDTPPTRDIYSISRLNQEARGLLEGSFPLLWVEGEISNFACPASGHWYFSLKDPSAQVRCAMFRNRNAHLGFVPKNGMQVLIRARISLYEARGEFQIITEHMEEAGDGALRREFEALKQKLMQQGLFATEHKQPLPESIQRIGVITSPTGAAIRDILTAVKRRYPAAQVIVYPVAVQGRGSAEQIADMLTTVEQRNEVDIILLARGGGSLEDLWSFNEEIVARAIYACGLPIVTGIGHEIDFTIADLVADVRAATPTAAAEMVTPDQYALKRHLQHLQQRLVNHQHQQIIRKQQHLEWLEQRLADPRRRLQELAQRCDDLQLRLSQAQINQIRHWALSARHLQEKLAQRHPLQTIHFRQQHLSILKQKLTDQQQKYQQLARYRFQQATRTLHAVSPLATLDRGYAIVTRQVDQTLLRDTAQVKKGERIQARLQHGQLVCEVQEIDPHENH